MTACSLYSQSTIRKLIVRDHRYGTTYSKTTIENLRQHLEDGKFDVANNQYGIIGNDFFKPEEIGMEKARNSGGNVTDYHPIDGFKRTFCGREIFSKYASDGDFNIVYDIPFTNPLLTKHFDALSSGNNYYPWNHFEGEIRFDPGFEKYYPVSLHNIQFRPGGCMYGAWVKESAGDWHPSLDPDNPGGHKDNNEIHPIDQGWSIQQEFVWKNKRYYNLFLAVDNSGKFESENDYFDTPINIWSKDTLSGNFAFAFELNRRQKEKLQITASVIAHNNVTIKDNDGNKHFLIFENDTIATIIEESNIELINVDFYNLGYKTSDNNILRGFFIVKTKLGKITTPRTHSGNINMKVSYEKKSNLIQTIKATLVKIKRLENNSFRYYDESLNKTYTFPTPLPSSYNENGVTVGFGSGQNRINTTISNLRKGEEYTFNNVSQSWSGFLTDKYFFEITCNNDGINLGASGIGGYPIKSRNESLNTLLAYEISDPLFKRPDDIDSNNESTYTTIYTSMFQLFFKVELLSNKVGKPQLE